jgi:hypothetical protein
MTPKFLNVEAANLFDAGCQLVDQRIRLAVERPSERASDDVLIDNQPRELCQNCVTCPPKPRTNTVIYGDTPMRIVVAGSR